PRFSTAPVRRGSAAISVPQGRSRCWDFRKRGFLVHRSRFDNRHMLGCIVWRQVLALEIEASRRPADGAAGNTRADPRDEYRQSTVGSATNSWRAAQARNRNRTDQRRQGYGQGERPAVPGLEDVPPQLCRPHRGDGSVRRTDDLILLALWLVNHGHGRSYRASDRRMDRKSDHASVRLEAGPSLSDPRPGRGLWRSL